MYLTNVENLIVHLARHEVLGLVVLCRVARLATDRIRSRALEPWERRSRRVSAQLLAFALGYALLSCLNPLVYERYFIVLSPVLNAVFVLDAMCVFASLEVRGRSGGGRGVAIAASMLALAVAATGVLRFEEIRGRLREITEPYRGPLDYVIPWIRAQYPHPEQLVIATNYEKPSLHLLSRKSHDRRTQPQQHPARARARTGPGDPAPALALFAARRDGVSSSARRTRIDP